ncbi:sugar phosphate isomerase/epimerase [bacterium]|nr:sugar phosphate isomerase/epimerase [bacterium]
MKYSVCNELFGAMPLGRAAALIRDAGYRGVEFAPYTIFGDFSAAAIAAGLAEARAALDGEGLAFAGFHWLMVGPEPLHLTAADGALRARSLDHLRRLIDAAGRLGGGALVLGSPKQRSTTPGTDRGAATARLAEGLAALAGQAEACSSRILLEALDSTQSDVVNTLAEARSIVESIGRRGVGGMFDFHNVGDERQPWDALIRENAGFIGHVHVNEMDGRWPGSGASDFAPAFAALRGIAYSGWVSMEIFGLPEDPGAVLRQSMALFSKCDPEAR